MPKVLFMWQSFNSLLIFTSFRKGPFLNGKAGAWRQEWVEPTLILNPPVLSTFLLKE